MALRGVPCALTIAGSDSGGGAGIQADLRTFARLKVHGVSAITCITAQNSQRVSAIEPCSLDILRSQLIAVYTGCRPVAAKTGMLYSSGIIKAVAAFLRQHPLPLVVDPVMVSTSGAQLLHANALKTLCDELLPLATLMTPNLDEASRLLHRKIGTVNQMRVAAKELHQRFGCAVLVKGGHLRASPKVVDVLYDRAHEVLLRANFIKGVRTHGTGCTYSAAITAHLARGLPLPNAVQHAKRYMSRVIAGM